MKTLSRLLHSCRRHPKAVFFFAVLLAVFGSILFLQQRPPDVRDFSGLGFRGVVEMNGKKYGAFAFTNLCDETLQFYVHTLEIEGRWGWEHQKYSVYNQYQLTAYSTNKVLGNQGAKVWAGQTQEFLLPFPENGKAWRPILTVLCGNRGFPTLISRARILYHTRSLAAASTANPSVKHHYSGFSSVGRLSGPAISNVTSVARSD